MQDLFEREEDILRRAKEFQTRLDDAFDLPYREEYSRLTLEYERILRQLRRVTRLADRTALDLNTDKLNLLDKVNVDALTGIYNRRFLELNLTHDLDVLSADQRPICVMMVDIDFFKKYNDTYGHSAGDACLRKVANTLHNSLSGADDFVARYGGEEFLVVLPGAPKNISLLAAERILENIHQLSIPHKNNEIGDFVTLSIGLTCAVPLPGQTSTQFIECADAALYCSKNHGRDQITYFDFQEALP